MTDWGPNVGGTVYSLTVKSSKVLQRDVEQVVGVFGALEGGVGEAKEISELVGLVHEVLLDGLHEVKPDEVGVLLASGETRVLGAQNGGEDVLGDGGLKFLLP